MWCMDEYCICNQFVNGRLHTGYSTVTSAGIVMKQIMQMIMNSGISVFMMKIIIMKSDVVLMKMMKMMIIVELMD
ncbi:MAG: hypothetical protein EZS28_020694 [Streblomastix strix]|uniref:Uncharacterized protein n=1 Tax=Streblomastix strix TaxID=222440 RepID=A0A5J4VMA6_9EUKA|nr:MAG: hypothetical protein EZS28_020694 [Streblomastix strix]